MRSIRPGPEGDANEAGHPDTRRRSDLQGDIALNRSVLNLDSLEKGEDIFIGLCGQANRFASLVFDCLCLPAGGYDQVVQIRQREAPRLLRSWLRRTRDLCVRGKGRRNTNQYGSRGAQKAGYINSLVKPRRGKRAGSHSMITSCFPFISRHRVTFRCTSSFATNCAPSCTQAMCARATAFPPAVSSPPCSAFTAPRWRMPTPSWNRKV